MKTRKVAYYLVRQGPYREPRTIDLQFIRLKQYQSFLRDKLDQHIERVGVYVDIDVDLDSLNLARWPELKRLIADIESGHIDTVLVDIEIGRPFRPYEFMPTLRTLEATGASIFNSFYDDEDAFQHAVEKSWGVDVVRVAFRDDIDDFVTLFPGLAAKIGKRLLEHYDKHLPPEVFDELWTKFSRFGDQNPYQSGLPLFNRQDRKRIGEAVEEQKRERRKTEELWQLGPDAEGKLVDDLYGDARTDKGMEWAKDRLNDLRFQEIRRGQLISYQRHIDGYVVYADPRKKGRIDFYVYDDQQDKRSRLGWRADFYILDSWKHDLPGMWDRRFQNTKKGT